MAQTFWMDRLIPTHFKRGGMGDFRKCRLIISFALLGMAWCLVFSVIFRFRLDLPSGSLLSLCGALGLAAIPWILRVTNPNVAGNFLILMVFGLIGSLTYSVGGFTAPLLIWYSVIPALAAVVTESRWSLVWGLVVVAHLLGLYTMELLGLSPTRLDSSDLDILSCVSIIGFMAVLYTLTQLYENFEYQALRRLRRTNRELARARDRALEASKAKTSFLANMSHELRTPLNAIIGYSELLLEELRPEDQHLERDLKRILMSGSHLAELVNGLLDLSKAESGKIEPELIQFQLTALLDEIEGTIGAQMQRNKNTFSLQIETSLQLLHTDALKLKQCLLNLLSNASKFTQEGTITLKVTSPQSGWIRFDVTDTGIGMTKDQQSRVFQPFVQADPTTARKYGGTGLGLTISEKFCQILGGELSVVSQPNKGSTFTIEIPTDPSLASLLKAPPEPRD
jgi:signal transduction histidine kinase